MSARITFFGGAGTATGVNILFETGETKLLLDCGLLQREAIEDEINRSGFGYDPKSVRALVVSHAHMDHIGRIPKLVREGFRGTIYSSLATKDLTRLMLHDALNVMRENLRVHKVPLLYEEDDVERTLSLWQTHEYHEPFTIDGVSVEFLNAGHILGSCMIRLSGDKKTLLYTGDLGNAPEPLLPAPESPEGSEYLIMESVYGDRLHGARVDRKAHLRRSIEETQKRKGVLLIPSFSIERTQILLHEINDMFEKEGLEKIDVYLDSPLASNVTDVYRAHAKLLSPEIQMHFEKGDDPFSFEGFTETVKKAESKAIEDSPNPKIIIAGSGMSSGGRIRHHEKLYIGNPDASILIVGYQSPGSLGRRLLDGARYVSIDGENLTVRARVEMITGYSGHMDRDALIDFAEKDSEDAEKVFVALGETRSSLFLAQRLHDFLGLKAIVPEKGDSYELEW